MSDKQKFARLLSEAFETLFDQVQDVIKAQVEFAIQTVAAKVDALAVILKDHDGKLKQQDKDIRGQAQSIAHLLGEAEKNKQGVIVGGTAGMTAEDEAKFETRLDDLLKAIDSKLTSVNERISQLEDTATTPTQDEGNGQDTTPALPPGRKRQSPITKVPRDQAEARVLEYWSDGGWHTADAMAAKHAKRGTPNYRYLRGNFTTILREFYLQGRMQRKDARQAGSNYSYRLTPTKDQDNKS